MAQPRGPKLQFGDRPGRTWRIVLGVILLLWSIGGLVKPIGTRATPGDVAGGIGSTLGLATLIAIGIGGFWLVRSGLPKSGGPR